jgi:ketosteroid isomerase-like protein
MKNIKCFFIAVFIVSLFSMQSFAQNKQDVESAKAQIEKLRTNFIEAFNKGDAQAMTKGNAENLIVFPPNAPEVKGSEAVAKLWQSFIDMGKGVINLKTIKVNVSGNLAVEYETYELEITTKENKVVKDNGISLIVFEKQKDGNWLRIYDTWNSSLPLPTSKEMK